MSNLQERCGTVVIRLGGNTQELAAMVPINSIPNGKSFSKAVSGKNTTVSTSLFLKVYFIPFLFIFTDTDTGCFIYGRYVLHDV